MSRKDDVEAIKDWDEFLVTANSMNEDIRKVLVRDRFTPGLKVRSPLLGEAQGTQAPHYADPTGDDASDPREVQDRTHQDIWQLRQNIKRSKAILEKLLDLANVDVRLRAERTIPTCEACADLVYDRVRAGFCGKCYKRWTRAGRPDRLRFIAEAQRNRPTAASVSPAGH